MTFIYNSTSIKLIHRTLGAGGGGGVGGRGRGLNHFIFPPVFISCIDFPFPSPTHMFFPVPVTHYFEKLSYESAWLGSTLYIIIISHKR